MTDATPASPLSARIRLGLLAGVLLLATVVAVVVGGPSADGLKDTFAGSGVAGALGFAALYAALTVALIPGAPLTIAAGVLYGAVGGTLVTLAGATAGATAAFAVARRTSRGTVEQLGSRRLARLDHRLSEHGLLAMLALRLVPVMPFNLLNYAAGASAMAARDYVLGTAVGIVPGAFAYAALGGSADDPGSPAFIGAAAAAAVLTAVGIVVARRSGQRAGEKG